MAGYFNGDAGWNVNVPKITPKNRSKVEAMEKPLRFAIVGCGVISPTHARSILELPGAELAAVCDLNEEKAERLSKAFPQDEHFPDVYTNFRAMI